MRLLDKTRLTELIGEHVEADVGAGKVLGAAIEVLQGDETVYQNFFGHADMGHTKSVTENTVFRMASMTKPLTAALAMALVDRALLDLDEPISNYLPRMKELSIGKLTENGEVSLIGKASTSITARQILSHTSGMGSGPLYLHYHQGVSPEIMKSLASAVDWYSTLPISFEPFTAFEYSATAAFDVLAYVMAMKTDTAYEELLKKLVLEPSGMKDTTFSPSEEQWGRMIDMHDYRDGKAIASYAFPGCVFEQYPTTHPAAGAGLISTLADYSNFARMLLDGGVVGGERVLSQEAVLEMMRVQAPFLRSDKQSCWGLGGRVITSDQYGALPVGTYGWSGAYGSHFWIDPANKIAAIYLKNSRFDGGSGNQTGKRLEKDVFEALI